MFLIRSGAMEGYERLVAELGENPVRLMARVDLSHAQLRNPNTYISYTRLAELLQLTADACADPLFGLRLSQLQTSTVLGDLAMTLAQLPTVGDALGNVNRHLYLHARGVHLRQSQRDAYLQLELDFDISGSRGLQQLAQMSVGQLANFLTELLDLDAPKFPILLRQSPPVSNGRHEDPQLLSRVVFGAEGDGIRIPAAWLARKPHRDEEALRRHFQDFMTLLEQRYPNNLQDQVRDIVGQILPSGECRIERVAAMLDLHPRVLQKRLQKQGASYVKLLQQTRRELAEQHLRHQSMSVTDLALNLGYADVSVFSRHFKQWTGLSPRNWQQQHG